MPIEMAKYLALYVSEAGDHLAKMGAELVQLEAAARAGTSTADVVDGLFRHAHSVKGMSAAMQLEAVAALAHRVEDLVAFYRGQGATPDTGAIDLLLAAVDGLSAMVKRAGENEPPLPDEGLVARLAEAAERARAQAAALPGAPTPTAAPEAAAESAPAADPAALEAHPPQPRRPLVVVADIAVACPVPSVRGFLVLKKLSRLGSVLRSAPSVQDLKAGRLPARRLEVTLDTGASREEVERALGQVSDLERVTVSEEVAPPARPAPAAPPPALPGAAADGRTLRVRVELLDSFLDAVGELILATARLRELGKAVPEPYRPALEEGVDRLHGTVKDLHDKVMAVRMTPLALITDGLPRAGRDLARRTGKQVELEVRGAEIEIDRAILDELGDGLVHVLRNAVDHGIEPPHLRLLAGKPATGRVTVSARRERDRVLIEIADDGKGMDPEQLRQAAVTRGALTAQAAAALSDREALQLACLPGVSTAAVVTELSGRGVGLDAVKRTVEGLGGAVEVESTRGAGTRWTLRLPLTVAVQPVLLVDVGREVLGLPVAKVHGAAQVDVAGLGRSQGSPVLPYQGRMVPVRDLGELLGFGAAGRPGPRSVVVADGDGGLVGLAVDALLGQHEAVLKPLTRPFDLVQGLSAVTVLGNGRPVFVLDVQRLVAA